MPDLPSGIRAARPDDVPDLLRLVVDLAIYERSEDQVETTEEQLRAALFGDEPVARALVAENEGQVVGFALYYLTYSTWVGRPGLHLEDLFVVPGARGTGLGEALMSALARVATTNDLGRMEWDCLDWNTPSMGFYDGLGARTVGGWVAYRLTGTSLHELAGRVAHRVKPTRDGAS